MQPKLQVLMNTGGVQALGGFQDVLYVLIHLGGSAVNTMWCTQTGLFMAVMYLGPRPSLA